MHYFSATWQAGQSGTTLLIPLIALRRFPVILLVGEASPIPSFSSSPMMAARSFRTLFRCRRKEKDRSRQHTFP